MAGEPEWTISEFTSLVENPDLTHAEVADLLPRRNANAVAFVRAGLHDFHRGRDNSFISQLVKRRLELAGAQYTCPRCRTPLG